MSGEIKSSAESSFPGFRFCPTDEELILFYLKKKLEGFEKCVDIVAEVDITQYEPWDLPGKSNIQSNNEWFFFSPRGRNCPKGIQSRRATPSGYWKAMGKERNIKSGWLVVGTKWTLVFHKGRAPKGERTEWVIHEFYMRGTPQDSLVICRLRRKGESSLDDIPELSLSGDSHTYSLVDDFQHKAVVKELTADDVEDNSVIEGFIELTANEVEDNSVIEEFIADGCYNPLPLESEYEHKLFQGESSHTPKCRGWDDASDYTVPVLDDQSVPVLDDDIFNLEESSSTDPWPKNILYDDYINLMIQQPTDLITPSTPSSQGTASRRIRLSNSPQGYRANPIEASNDEDVKYSSQRTSRRTKLSKPEQIYRVDPVKPSSDESNVKYSMTSPPLNVAPNNRLMALVILTLLVLCLSFLCYLTWFWQRRTVVHSLGLGSRMLPDGHIGEGVE